MSAQQIHRFLAAGLIGLAWSVAAAEAPPPKHASDTITDEPPFIKRSRLTVDHLIDDLGSPSHEERERATQQLKSNDKSFTEDLKRAYADAPDHEVRLRLREVAEYLFYRDALMGFGGFLGIEMGVAYLPRLPQETTLEEQGVRLKAVIPNTAAERAGLQSGDIIIGINEEPLRPENHEGIRDTLGRLIRSYDVGDELRLTTIRDQATMVTQVTLGFRPLNIALSPPFVRILDTQQRALIVTAGREFTQWCDEVDRAR